jgi:hypothetical protein
MENGISPQPLSLYLGGEQRNSPVHVQLRETFLGMDSLSSVSLKIFH